MLSVREISENIEQETLAPWAAKSSQAVRDSEEAADDLRTAFQRDRDRIIHSTPFRKLKHKTQVYLCPVIITVRVLLIAWSVADCQDYCQSIEIKRGSYRSCCFRA